MEEALRVRKYLPPGATVESQESFSYRIDISISNHSLKSTNEAVDPTSKYLDLLETGFLELQTGGTDRMECWFSPLVLSTEIETLSYGLERR